MSDFFTAHRIGKSFHLRSVLKDVTFTLDRGENVFLFGRNGCGKTTLLQILAGTMRPEKGSASLNGEPLFTTQYNWRRFMVYLGHQPFVYPAFTARENLTLALRLRGDAWDESLFQKQLQRYGLQGREDDEVGVYSQGMMQRLGLIRLTMSSWQLAYLDEPTSALDVDGIQRLDESIRDWKAAGKTLLFTSHDMAWGSAQADRALLLENGTMSPAIMNPSAGDLLTHVGGGD